MELLRRRRADGSSRGSTQDDSSQGAWGPMAALVLVVAFVVAALTDYPVRGFDTLTRLVPGISAGPEDVQVVAQVVYLAVAAVAVRLAVTRPWVGLGVAAAATAFALVVPPSTPLTVFVVLGGVAVTSAWDSPRVSAAAAALAVVAAWVWWVLPRGLDLPFGGPVGVDDDRWSVAFGITASFGLLLLFVRARRNEQRLWLERTLLEAREGRLVDREGVVAERARLARDLHDVVAHHVSLIAVRAETAPYTHPDLGPSARTVLADVATDARLALDELRGVLGILGRAGQDERAPQPTWEDVPALVERAGSTGVEVVLRRTGSRPVECAVDGAVGYAAYRVVQEALTNARRHAPGAAVVVGLDAGSAPADPVVVVVRSGLGTGRQADTTGSGRGLAGMRERVEGLGGRLSVGPRGEEFVVEAVLPGERGAP